MAPFSHRRKDPLCVCWKGMTLAPSTSLWLALKVWSSLYGYDHSSLKPLVLMVPSNQSPSLWNIRWQRHCTKAPHSIDHLYGLYHKLLGISLHHEPTEAIYSPIDPLPQNLLMAKVLFLMDVRHAILRHRYARSGLSRPNVNSSTFAAFLYSSTAAVLFPNRRNMSPSISCLIDRNILFRMS